MLLAATPLSFCAPPNPLSSLRPSSSSSPSPSPLLKSRDFGTLLSTSSQPLLLSSSPSRLQATPTSGKFLRKDYLIEKFSAKEIQSLVRGERNVPMIIDFYATWCGPCTLMAQELEMLAVEYESNLMIVKVDTDEEYEFARDMQVRGLPTLYFISPDPSKDAIRTEGLIPIQMMRNIIDKET